MFVTVNDFKQGKFALHSGMYDVARIQDYINKYEPRYLMELMGVDLYNEFQADIIIGGGLPFEQRFIDIFEPLYRDLNFAIIMSEGFIEMLKGFIYYEYTKDQIVQMTQNGNVRPVGQNSEVAGSLYTQIYTRYNDAIRSYKSIQWFVVYHSGDYAGFNGRKKENTTWI